MIINRTIFTWYECGMIHGTINVPEPSMHNKNTLALNAKGIPQHMLLKTLSVLAYASNLDWLTKESPSEGFYQ